MNAVVTAKVKLADFYDILSKTMSAFSQAVQFYIDVTWEYNVKHRNKLHKLCYPELRERFHLHSQLACNTIK